MTSPLGISTGIFGGSSPGEGVAAAAGLGLQAVEVSALSEPELPGVLDLVSGLSAGAAFVHVSVHAPAKALSGNESVRSRLLEGTGLPVVLHPDVISDPGVWAPLGERLLVENMDARKRAGRTVEDLSRLFEILPSAGFCLDVSHALSSGGPALVLDLHAAFEDRLRLLHVGCASGEPVGDLLEDQTLAVLADLVSRLERPVPVILERSLAVPVGLPVPADLAAQAAQLKGLPGLA